jgi:prophage antirepressor-like protein
MNNQIVFAYNTDQAVRTFLIEGEPWFVISDICSILNLGNITETIKRLKADEFSTTEVIDNTGKRKQKMYICNEWGLYTLIFESRKEEAEKFKEWVKREVLPSIRKTGKYELTQSPLSTMELMRQQLDYLIAHEKQLQQHQAKLDDHETRLNEIEAKIKTTNKDYFSLAGYYALQKRNWNLSVKDAQNIGKLLTKASQTAGFAVIKVQDSKYGEVNGYHKDILQEVLKF